MARVPLTQMQEAYLWLMGSFPSRIMVQGRGKRTDKLLYRFDGEDEIVIFGYGTPNFFLENRGLIRKLQAPHSYALTPKGEDEFKRLLTSGAGLRINQRIRETNR